MQRVLRVVLRRTVIGSTDWQLNSNLSGSSHWRQVGSNDDILYQECKSLLPTVVYLITDLTQMIKLHNQNNVTLLFRIFTTWYLNCSVFKKKISVCWLTYNVGLIGLIIGSTRGLYNLIKLISINNNLNSWTINKKKQTIKIFTKSTLNHVLNVTLVKFLLTSFDIYLYPFLVNTLIIYIPKFIF